MFLTSPNKTAVLFSKAKSNSKGIKKKAITELSRRISIGMLVGIMISSFPIVNSNIYALILAVIGWAISIKKDRNIYCKLQPTNKTAVLCI